MDEALRKQLQVLLDERDIHRVLTLYCRGVDRCDAALIASCYHPDAVDDHGTWQAWGRDAASTIIDRVQPGPDVAMHFLGNVHIDVEGDTAYTESYLMAYRAYQREGQAYTRVRALRFVDRFTRREGQWRIAERVVADDWHRVDRVVEPLAEARHFRRGAKGPDDPVYTIRRGPLARPPLSDR